jgi:hypothetical protein
LNAADYIENLLSSFPVNYPSVRKNPYSSFQVFFYIVDSSSDEKRVIEMLDVVSIERIQPPGSAEPYDTVFFFIYAVYRRSQTVMVRYLGVYVLLACCKMQGGEKDVEADDQSFHIRMILG